MEGALIGGLTGAGFGFVNVKIPNWGLKKIVAHGLVGGTGSRIAGGSFRQGFLSAGFTQFAAPGIDGILPGNTDFTTAASRTAAAAVVGGTASELGGGKFANGAVTGAFSRLFNDELQRDQSITEEQLALAKNGEFEAFWDSRWSVNRDPVARTALDGIYGRTAAARYTWGRLRAYIADNGLNVSMEQISSELAFAHAQAVMGDMGDTSGIPGLLSPGQVASYHHQVFGRHKIPASMFGGTMGVPAVRVPVSGGWAQPIFSATTFSNFWCRGCDSVP